MFPFFNRCKVHKVVLHTLLACVNTNELYRTQQDPSFTEDILLFNEVYPDGNETNTTEKTSNYSEEFLVSVFFIFWYCLQEKLQFFWKCCGKLFQPSTEIVENPEWTEEEFFNQDLAMSNQQWLNQTKKVSRSQILFPDSNSSTGSVAGHAGANR